MNLECGEPLEPLRVIIINPLLAPARLIAVKILNGRIFGKNQLVDLTLLVFTSEMLLAESFKFELEGCAFPCTNAIKITSDLPSYFFDYRVSDFQVFPWTFVAWKSENIHGIQKIMHGSHISSGIVTDADVFCFITSFVNPNALNLEKLGYEEYFDPLYLIVKIANGLQWPEKPEEPYVPPRIYVKPQKKKKTPIKEPLKPIFMTDGLVPLDILKSLSKNIPNDVFFCSTPIPAVAKSVLAEQLKVRCDMLNKVLVWAANDQFLHVEFEKPLVVNDEIGDGPCDWDMVGKDVLAACNLDHTQFSESWIKKDLIYKSVAILKKNPYGRIAKAAEFAKALNEIWMARSNKDHKVYTNMGVISDGSLDTLKGFPFVLPVVFTGDKWSVRKQFEDTCHLQHEIKRLNKAVKIHHQKVIPFCKKFLEEQFLQDTFVPLDEDVESVDTQGSVQADSSWPASVSYGRAQ